MNTKRKDRAKRREARRVQHNKEQMALMQMGLPYTKFPAHVTRTIRNSVGKAIGSIHSTRGVSSMIQL